MPTEEDTEKETDEKASQPESSEPPDSSRPERSPTDDDAGASLAKGEDAPNGHSDAPADTGSESDDDDGVVTPTQLGTRRFVYAAYFAAAIAIAVLLSKIIDASWTRLNLWKPEFGEPQAEILMPISALIGAGVAVYYYRDQKTRTLIDEVASELSKVTWPNRETVMNSTFVVIVTTLLATTFFALMDRFWGFVTNLVYGA